MRKIGVIIETLRNWGIIRSSFSYEIRRHLEFWLYLDLKCSERVVIDIYLLFFALWVIFNGKLNLEIALFGIVIAAFMFFFFCKYMDYSAKTEIRIVKKIGHGIHYAFILIREIFKANFQVMYLILSSKVEVEPKLVYFKTKLKKDTSKVILANSITLTPGTITVTLEEDEYCVHCLDKELADGIDSSIFVSLLTKMEENR